MKSQNSVWTLPLVKSNKSDLPKSIFKGAIQFFDSIEETLMFLHNVQRYSKLNLTNHFLNMKQKYHVCRLMHVEKKCHKGIKFYLKSCLILKEPYSYLKIFSQLNVNSKKSWESVAHKIWNAATERILHHCGVTLLLEKKMRNRDAFL